MYNFFMKMEVLPISLRSCSKRNKCQNTVLTFLTAFKGVDLHGGG